MHELPHYFEVSDIHQSGLEKIIFSILHYCTLMFNAINIYLFFFMTGNRTLGELSCYVLISVLLC